MKDLLAFLFRYADPRVGDREVERGLVFAQRLDFYAQYDFASLGKFDGIAHQVDGDPAQAVGISHQTLRHLGPDVARQLEAFVLGPQRQRFQGVLKRLSQIEGSVIQFELPRLDFGEVEDIVDQGEK